MEDKEFQQIYEEVAASVTKEPEISDNSIVTDTVPVDESIQQNQEDGQSEIPTDPSESLILGKFKTVDDLSKAYKELETLQGSNSEELGFLRKQFSSVNELAESCDRLIALQNGMLDMARRDREKYNSPEYFQNPTFTEMYKEAFLALGDDLDTDKFINLLEAYVSSRIFANDRKKAAQQETRQSLDSMTYSKNINNSFTPPKKRLDEMTEKEIDELLDRLI